MILTRYLERDLREVPDALTFSERVYKALEHETPLRDSVAKSMAAALNTTPRTLARRLHDEGTSFGQLLDDVRRTRATRYLDDDAMSVQEIAAALGFSSASAFHRAFKRWMGITPQDYRRAQRDR
jgi:AraC-like DNA-binding protein